MYVTGMRALYDFPGHIVYEVSVDPHIAELKLRPDRRRTLRCGACGGRMTACRTLPQCARDLALGPLPMVLIRYQAVQGHCRRCRRYETVHPPGIEPRCGATWRLMRYASQLARFMPVRRVAQLLPIGETVIRRWDREVLQRTLPEPDLDAIRVLLVDEKSIDSHHQYATVVMNGESGELLHLAEGKKKRSLEGFFDLLTPQQKRHIEAVGIDRNGAYREVVRERISAGANVHDTKLLQPTLEAVAAEPPDPVSGMTQHLCLDKGYDNPTGHAAAEVFGYRPHIRPIGEQEPAAEQRDHPPRRWVVERTHAWLNGCRKIATRYTKKSSNYLGLIKLACILLWYRKLARSRVLG